MLRTERMYKLTVIGAKKYLEEVVDALYDLGAVHIKEYEKSDEFFDIGKPFEKSERISKLLMKVRAILSLLPKDVEVDGKRAGSFKKFDELEAWCIEIHEKLEKLHDALRKYTETQEKLKTKAEHLKMLEKLNLKPELLTEYSTIQWKIILTKNDDLVKKLESKAKDVCEFRVAEYDGGKLIAVFYRKDAEKKVNEIMSNYEHAVVELKELEGMEGSPTILKKEVEKELVKVEKEIEKLQEKIKEIAKRVKPILLYWQEVLEEEAEKAEAPLKFATSPNVFMLKGWVPKKNAEKVKKTLEKITNKTIYLKFEEVDEKKENAPVKFAHPKGVDNFQYFMEMYSLPRYSEIDPTLFVALTFPVYFGFILGDVGYGLTSLIAFLLLRQKFPNLKKLMNIFIFSAIMTIVFGFVYGEFFGLNEIAGIKMPVLIHRVHETMDLLLISVAIGIIHVNLGFILGIINEWKLHGFKKALFEKASWLIIEGGVVMYYLASKSYIAIPKETGIAVTLAGVVMLAKGEGIKGVVELPTLLSHTLSYARLMGAGIASAGLAMVIDSIAGQLMAKGSVFVLFAILLVIMGHVMNIMLGIMEGFLHSLRLNYVEFFTKFFIGGGFPYNPFGKKSKMR